MEAVNGLLNIVKLHSGCVRIEKVDLCTRVGLGGACFRWRRLPVQRRGLETRSAHTIEDKLRAYPIRSHDG